MLPFLTQTEIDRLAANRKGTYLTLQDMSARIGADITTVRRFRTAIEPDAQLASGLRGRPAMLYRASKQAQLARAIQS